MPTLLLDFSIQHKNQIVWLSHRQQGNRDVQWGVSKAVKQAVATRRIEELSVPSK